LKISKKLPSGKELIENFFDGKAVKHLLLSILSGLLMASLFPKISLWFLAWIALLPLLVVIYEAKPKTSFFLGWLTGTVFFLGLTYWLLFLYSFVKSLSILAWITLSVFQGLFYGIFALGAGSIRKNFIGWGRLFAIPAWWVTLEFLRSNGYLAFSWGILGYSQQAFSQLSQIAAVTGVYGISFIVVMVNIALVEMLMAPLEKVKRSLAYLGVALIILLEIIGGGFLFIRNQAKESKESIAATEKFNIVAVQGNVPQDQKWDPYKEDQIKKSYYDSTVSAARSNPYIVIWPESAVPSFLLSDSSYLEKLEHLAKSHRHYILTGSLHLDRKSRQYNSAVLISPRGEVEEKYDKMRLVLFGEYTFKFMVNILRRFEGMSWVGESIVPGNEHTVFETERGNLSTVICFESGDARLCRQMVKNGAQLLVVITNDAWFGKSAAPYQHMQISSFRAIENGVYLVQVANTGITAVVNPQGEIIKTVSPFKKKLLTANIAFQTGRTIYQRWGDIFSYICLLLSVGFLASGLLPQSN